MYSRLHTWDFNSNKNSSNNSFNVMQMMLNDKQ